MPTYTYQCSCGLQFEGRNSLAKHQEPIPCPECGAKAARAMPETVSGFFKKDVTGPGPQNTGIHDLDTHIDRVIGQHAQQGWGVAEKRVGDKRQVLANNPGTSGHDLSRNPDGTYRVLAPEERGVHDRAQGLHRKAMEQHPALKKRPASPVQ